MDWGHILFGFSGRINRAKYWLAFLVYIIIGIALVILGLITDWGMLSLIAAGIIFIGLIVSGLAVVVKRLHDRNKSAAWLLVFYLLPMLLSGVGVAVTIYGAADGGSSMESIGSIFSLIGSAISLWALVELGFLRGTVGANLYGPDPLEGRL